MKNVHLYLSVHYVRVLGKMGEFEGELRERLSSLRRKGLGLFAASCGPTGGGNVDARKVITGIDSRAKGGSFPLKTISAGSGSRESD